LTKVKFAFSLWPIYGLFFLFFCVATVLWHEGEIALAEDIADIRQDSSVVKVASGCVNQVLPVIKVSEIKK